MTTLKLLTAISCAALMLTACNGKDPGHNTDHPGHAKIRLTTDWSQTNAGAVPAAYSIDIGPHSAQHTENPCMIDHLFDPGNYHGHVYNKPAGYSVSGCALLMTPVNTPAGYQGAFVPSDAEYFYSGTINEVLEKDRVHDVKVLMVQQTGEVAFVMEPKGGTAERVASVEIVLNGVAQGWNMDKETPTGTAASVHIALNRDQTGKWKGECRLLGVTGSAQEVITVVRFTDNVPAEISETFDITSQMAGFNANKRRGVTLGAQLVDVPTAGAFTAVITDWVSVDEGTGTGDLE